MLSKALEWASVSLEGPLFWGTWRGALFLGPFQIKRYIKRYVQMPYKRVSLSIGSRWETWMGFAVRDFLREKERIFGSLCWTQRTLIFKSGGHLELW
jgi:hypothetical protein